MCLNCIESGNGEVKEIRRKGGDRDCFDAGNRFRHSREAWPRGCIRCHLFSQTGLIPLSFFIFYPLNFRFSLHILHLHPSITQQNVDAAAEKLRAKGIEVLGVVCHVSNPQQRKDLIDKTVQVRSSDQLSTLYFSYKYFNTLNHHF